MGSEYPADRDPNVTSATAAVPGVSRNRDGLPPQFTSAETMTAARMTSKPERAGP
jgi:hypothetical protein